MNTVRLLLFEKDRDLLLKIRTCIRKQPDMVIVSETTDQTRLLEIINELQINVVLMNPKLLHKAKRIHVMNSVSEMTNAQLIVLDEQIDNQLISEACFSKATNYIIKSHVDNLPNVIRLASLGWTLIRGDVSNIIRNEYCQLKKLEIKYRKEILTPTERKILKLVANGYTQSEIASELFIEVKTVKRHVTNLLSKMGEKRSKVAAQKAKEWGIL